MKYNYYVNFYVRTLAARIMYTSQIRFSLNVFLQKHHIRYVRETSTDNTITRIHYPTIGRQYGNV